MALYTTMRDILPDGITFYDTTGTSALCLPHAFLSSLSTVWEDNQAALALATVTDLPVLHRNPNLLQLSIIGSVHISNRAR